VRVHVARNPRLSKSHSNRSRVSRRSRWSYPMNINSAFSVHWLDAMLYFRNVAGPAFVWYRYTSIPCMMQNFRRISANDLVSVLVWFFRFFRRKLSRYFSRSRDRLRLIRISLGNGARLRNAQRPIFVSFFPSIVTRMTRDTLDFHVMSVTGAYLALIKSFVSTAPRSTLKSTRACCVVILPSRERIRSL